MIPAFIPFIIASLSGIVALLMCPIVISTRILAGDHPVHTQDSELFAFLTVMIVTSKYQDFTFKTADWNRNC